MKIPELKRPTEKKLLGLLKDIEASRLSVELDKVSSADAISTENGIYYFITSNNWRMGIFVDCGKFDYIDSISHGGTSIDHEKLEKHYPRVVKYVKRYRDKNLAELVLGIETKT